MEVRSSGERYSPRGPKVRAVLALLLLGGNQVVDVNTLATDLWDGAAPEGMLTTLRTHVYHLRKMLRTESGTPALADRLITRPSGYLFELERDELDSEVFSRLVARGRTLLHEGWAEDAAQTLRTALALWRGPALTDVVAGRVLSRHVVSLDELRLVALEARIEADLLLGRHRELVPELRGLVTGHPLNEWLRARLVEALHRCGRRDDALAVIRDLRAVLNEELGLELSGEIARLQQEILTDTTEYRPEHWSARYLAAGGARRAG
jgi:DNA-binding SARP family transcriptional activator